MSHENNTVQSQDFPADTNTHENDTSPVSEDTSLEYDSFSENLDQTTQEEKQSKDSSESARIQELENALSLMKDQMIRAMAEAENTRKRAQKDREEASKYAISGFARDLLSVADNLRRALDAIPAELLQNEQVKNLSSGIEATERELLRSFDKNGIQKLEPLEQTFDPNFHEVMFEAPVPGKAGGTIIQVLEPGYVLNGRILRPARVGIAKGDDISSSGGPQSPGHTLDTQV